MPKTRSPAGSHTNRDIFSLFFWLILQGKTWSLSEASLYYPANETDDVNDFDSELTTEVAGISAEVGHAYSCPNTTIALKSGDDAIVLSFNNMVVQAMGVKDNKLSSHGMLSLSEIMHALCVWSFKIMTWICKCATFKTYLENEVSAMLTCSPAEKTKSGFGFQVLC